MTDFLLDDLRRAVRSAERKPLIVCGAGVSIHATRGRSPSWAKLIRTGITQVKNLDANAGLWAEECFRKLDTGRTDTWIAIADEVTERLGGPQNAEFGVWLQDQVGQLVLLRRDLLNAIAALNCPIATTNYDHILTEATGLPPVSWSDHAETLRILHDPHQVGILHLHGHWRLPQSVVLGSKTYADHSADDRRKMLQNIATLERPTVFIGCSQDGLTDPDFSRLDSFLHEWQDVAPRRYWLIRQEIDENKKPRPVPSPDLARRLFPVVFGENDEDILSILRSLASTTSLLPTSDPDTMIRCIDQHEPKLDIVGRDNENELIVGALLAGRHAIVAGGPGMGKTAVAINALYDPRVIDRFRRRRVFTTLETATEPREILAKLAEALGLPPAGDEASLLRILAASAAEQPIAAILDNAETVLEIDRDESSRLLKLTAQNRGLSLIITVRGVAPDIPGVVAIEDLPKLSPADARRAFLTKPSASFETDPDLPYLLDALDGHALSINLVAAQAGGLPTLKGLRELWDEARAEILRRPGENESRLTSVRASLALSLRSRRMRTTPLARRLLGLLTLLPDGVAEIDVAQLLGDRGAVTRVKASQAIGCLHQLRLVERRLDRRLRMLTPLRECARLDIPVMPLDRQRLVSRFLAIASKAGKVGRGDWDQVREEVEAEANNLDPICMIAVEARTSSRELERALRGLADFHRLSGRATVASLVRAVALFRKKFPRLAAQCIFDLGQNALKRLEYKTAADYFEEALALAQSSDPGRANCIFSLGDIALRQMNYTVAAERFQEARQLAIQIGDTLLAASCSRSLGEIARARSELEPAAAHYEEALTLSQQAGTTVGEANCILFLGEIARYRSEFNAAVDNYQSARMLYRRSGAVIGEANSLYCLGRAALGSRDHTLAQNYFREAQELYRRIGAMRGEANCNRHLGEIFLFQGIDYEASLARLNTALVLYPLESSPDIAETMIRRGQARICVGDAIGARADIELGFQKLRLQADPYDRARTGWQALYNLLTYGDTAQLERQKAKAREAWTLVGRLDLIREWLDLVPDVAFRLGGFY